MSLISIFILAAGLSVDSLAASVSTGVCMKTVRTYESVKIALYMAIFQGTLPIVGWFIGRGFKHIISSYDHWIAFILLLVIGGKMIFEGLKNEQQDECFCPSRPIILASMALATSIDALIVGVGIGLLGNTIWLPAIIIGLITFIFSFSGIYLGHHLGHRLNIKLELIGGLVLIGLGIKILIEHTLIA